MRATQRALYGLAMLGLFAVVGCSVSRSVLRAAEPAELQSTESVTEWQQLARPDSLALLGALVALAEASSGSCPQRSRVGQWTILHGGCTDDSGKRWTGQARMLVDDTRIRARFHDFGNDGGRASGRVDLSTEPHSAFEMDAHFVKFDESGSEWMALDVRGHKNATGEWSGQGQLATEALGRVRMAAQGIVLDPKRCRHEPVRGELDLWSSTHHARLRYDGADDCDRPGTARWSLDGVDRREISGVGGGIHCTPEPEDSIPHEGLIVVVLSLGRRRARRRR